MKPIDIAVISAICAWIVFAVMYIIKRKKSGKCFGCGGDCPSCVRTAECSRKSAEHVKNEKAQPKKSSDRIMKNSEDKK